MRIIKEVKFQSPHSDQGTILVWFIAIALVILGSGALVIDYGALWSERRQLQNGADAAALAVAIDCAKSSCIQSQTTALNYTQLNVADGNALVRLCGRGAGLATCARVPPGTSAAAGYVQVVASTWNPTNNTSPEKVRFLLAPFLDALQVGKTVSASATVIWGALSASEVLPVVISKCAFKREWIAADGSLSIPSTQIEIKANQNANCTAGWTDGFDFLEDLSGTCQKIPVNITSGDTSFASGAEGMLPQCRPLIQAIKQNGQTLVVPIVYKRTPAGTNSKYYADGFASFKLCGYALGGGYISNSCSTICGGSPSDFRICGTFMTLTLDSGELGNGVDYGTRVLRMVE